MKSNGQAPDVDDICAQLLKLVEKVMQWLTNVALIVWGKEKVLKNWLKQLTIPLYKKWFVP